MDYVDEYGLGGFLKGLAKGIGSLGAGLGLSALLPGLGTLGMALGSGLFTGLTEKDLKKGIMSGLTSYVGGKALSSAGQAAQSAARQQAADKAADLTSRMANMIPGASMAVPSRIVAQPLAEEGVRASLASGVKALGSDVGRDAFLDSLASRSNVSFVYPQMGNLMQSIEEDKAAQTPYQDPYMAELAEARRKYQKRYGANPYASLYGYRSGAIVVPEYAGGSMVEYGKRKKQKYAHGGLIDDFEIRRLPIYEAALRGEDPIVVDPDEEQAGGGPSGRDTEANLPGTEPGDGGGPAGRGEDLPGTEPPIEDPYGGPADSEVPMPNFSPNRYARPIAEGYVPGFMPEYDYLSPGHTTVPMDISGFDVIGINPFDMPDLDALLSQQPAMLESIAERFPVEGMRGGGMVDGYPTGGLIESAMAALMGRVPPEDAERILRQFVEEYGEEALAELQRMIAEQQAQMPKTEGMVSGPGGGLDDLIPASVDGANPVALSGGEYVIPADVVAMLGDGSSEEGARRLDQLRNDIRKEKTGTTQQAPPINPGILALA